MVVLCNIAFYWTIIHCVAAVEFNLEQKWLELDRNRREEKSTSLDPGGINEEGENAHSTLSLFTSPATTTDVLDTISVDENRPNEDDESFLPNSYFEGKVSFGS